MQTLWFNTGTLCNIACENCYIESSPDNDRLSYLSLDEVNEFLDELQRDSWPTEEIGITGGEPFLNPHILPIMQACLKRGYRLLVLTNAMRPMLRPRIQAGLLDLAKQYPTMLTLRVSIDHFKPKIHEQERGAGSWRPMLRGLQWLQHNGLVYHVAGRTRWGESEAALRQGYQQLFNELGLNINAQDSQALVLFPEIDPAAEVPEITTACWGILDVDPNNMMCASSRMIVKHKHACAPAVMACTLLAYDEQFNLGATLAQANRCVSLNHASCATFCVLGGGSCRG